MNTSKQQVNNIYLITHSGGYSCCPDYNGSLPCKGCDCGVEKFVEFRIKKHIKDSKKPIFNLEDQFQTIRENSIKQERKRITKLITKHINHNDKNCVREILNGM